MVTNIDGKRIRGPQKRTGKGVYWREDRQCWVARITVSKKGQKEKNIHLGHFDQERDALKARAKAEENLKANPGFYN
jgi:hypothetical protein